MDRAANTETKFLRLKWRRAFDRWRGKAALLVIAAKGYDPNQPRVPAGNPNGGQWTGDGGGSGTSGRRPNPDEGRVLSDATPDNLQKPGARLAQARGPRRSPRRSSRLTDPFLRNQAEGRAERAFERVRDFDPRWQPSQSLTTPTTGGAIAKRRGETLEAVHRLQELAKQPPQQLIQTYRSLNNSRDLFRNESWPRDRDTVSVTTIGGIPYVGASSGAPTYTTRDRRIAEIAVRELAAKHPRIMKRGNIGHKPNDALYHAEATILLRAAKANRGTLRGRRFEVHTDRSMCDSCTKVLPLLGRALGNPTVTFVSPNGLRRTMRNGAWLD